MANKTGISKLTLGTVQLGMDYGISNATGKPGMDQCHKILDAAAAGGITCFDTAAGYGDSESILGEYFSESRAKFHSRPVIATKVKTKCDTPLSRGEAFDAVRRSLEESLSRLRRDRVEILMLHSPSDLLCHGQNIVRAMERVRSEGLAEQIGVSVYTPAETDKVMEYGAFDAIQVPVNVMDVRLIQSGLLEKLKEAGIIVFARSIYLQGLFFLDPKALPLTVAGAEPYLRILGKAACDADLTMAQLAFSYVRDLPGIDSMVVGAETPDQVKSNVDLLNAPALSSGIVEMLQREFRDIPERVINPSFWK